MPAWTGSLSYIPHMQTGSGSQMDIPPADSPETVPYQGSVRGVPDIRSHILESHEARRFINFEFSNQYMLFLRNCDGLNVSDKSFKVLELADNKITLEEEV